jgi:hypothetical protein
METLLVRYGLPGIPSSLTIYIALIFLSQTKKLNIDPSSASVITALTISTVLIGYLYFQTWMLIFEGTKKSYKSGTRRALTKIEEEYSDKRLSSDDLYAIWESVLYRKGNQEKEIFKKDKTMWSFYHQNKSFVLGHVSSALISSLLILFLPGLGLSKWWLVFIPIVQIILALLAEIKARQTFNLIEIIEGSLVDTWASDFAEAIEIVLNSRKNETVSQAKRKNR